MEKRTRQAIFGGLLALVGLGALDWSAGHALRGRFALNLTSSLPMGVYTREAWEGEIGVAVVVLPTQKAVELKCVASIRQTLGKRIGAIEGEEVCRQELVLSSKHFRVTSEEDLALVIEDGSCVTVPKGHVWLYTAHTRSCDSRVLGPIPIKNIQGQVTPLWIWQ